MRFLAIDGALGAFSAATGSDDGALPERAARTSGMDALERGLYIVDDALGGERLGSFDGIAVGTGPGGFTGLRVALSYAKSLAFAARLPLAGISSYDAQEPAETETVHATFVHGRAGIACVRLRGCGDDLVVCGSYEQLATAIAERLPAAFHAGQTLTCYGRAEGTALALGERGLSVRTIPSEVDVPALAVLRRAMRVGVFSSPHAAVADYGEAHYAERSKTAASGTAAR